MEDSDNKLKFLPMSLKSILVPACLLYRLVGQCLSRIVQVGAGCGLPSAFACFIGCYE